MIRLTHRALRCLTIHLAPAKTLIAVLSLAFATTMMVGCGGGDEAPAADAAAENDAGDTAAAEPTKPPAPPKQAPGAKKGGGNGRQALMPNGGGMAPPGGGGAGIGAVGDEGMAGGMGGRSNQQVKGPPAEPPRSKDFAKWSAEDYKNSVRERDQRASEAVVWLASNKPDDASAKLLVELLLLSKEPAKQPPAGTSSRPGGLGGRRGGAPANNGRAPAMPNGGGNGRMPSMPGGGGGGGAGAGEVGSLDTQLLQEILVAGISGNLDQLLLTSTFIQNGPPQGYGQNGPPGGGGYGGDQSGGPEGGYQDGPGGGQGYGGGGDQSMNGPPEGYQDGPGGGGYGGDSSMNGPPANYSGAPGYGGGAGNNNSQPSGGNRGSNGGGLAGGNFGGGDYSHYGTLNMNEFVGSVVTGLIKIDSPKAWDAVAKLLEGSLSSPIEPAETSEMVLKSLMANYGGPGHPTHMLLTGIVKKDTPEAQKAVELFTDYAGTAIDQLLGLVEAASEADGTDQAGQRNGGGLGGRNAGFGGGGPPGNGRSASFAGGGGSGAGAIGGGGPPGNGRGAGFGGGNGAGAIGGGGPPGNGRGAGFGGGNGRGAGFAGGGRNGGNNGAPPAQNIQSLSMKSNTRPMTDEQLKNFTTFLWNKDFTQSVAAKLSESPTLSESAQLLALAGSLPTSDARKAYFSVLAKNQDGPDSFINAGFFNRIAKDPGVLVALKGLSQKRRSAGSIQSRWDEAIKQSALALRDRLRGAAERGGATGGVVPTSIMRLHEKGATADVVLRQSWPRDLNGAIGDSKPSNTEVLYIQVRASGNMSKVIKHYQGRVGSSHKKVEVNDESRRISWLTGVRTQKTGMKRSIDVIFSEDRSTPAGGGLGGGGNGRGAGFGGGGLAGGGGRGGAASQSALIEIIIVDTPNPNPVVNSASLDK